jgi:hypothetical protein
MSRLVRAAVAALLIGLMAVTPLSAVISPGHFELRLPTPDALSGNWHTVELDDHTGLVRGLRAYTESPDGVWEDGVSNPGGVSSQLLVIRWSGGCGAYQTNLVVDRTSDGYVVQERSFESNCPWLILKLWQVAVVLWVPVDARTMRFVSLD